MWKRDINKKTRYRACKKLGLFDLKREISVRHTHVMSFTALVHDAFAETCPGTVYDAINTPPNSLKSRIVVR